MLGGGSLLDPFKGKDIEDAYTENDHSEIADRMLHQHLIGKLDKGQTKTSDNDSEGDSTASSSIAKEVEALYDPR